MKIWNDERGMTTLPTVVAASFALVAFIAVADLVLVQYARGVARTAVDEAVRTSSVRGGDVGMCLGAVQAVLDDLLGGSFGADLAADCVVNDEAVFASVAGVLPPLLPILPSFAVAVEASSSLP